MFELLLPHFSSLMTGIDLPLKGAGSNSHQLSLGVFSFLSLPNGASFPVEKNELCFLERGRIWRLLLASWALG